MGLLQSPLPHPRRHGTNLPLLQAALPAAPFLSLHPEKSIQNNKYAVALLPTDPVPAGRGAVEPRSLRTLSQRFPCGDHGRVSQVLLHRHVDRYGPQAGGGSRVSTPWRPPSPARRPRQMQNHRRSPGPGPMRIRPSPV
ncbi:uncharacterized protein LOC143198338 [Rhynchophorus ferrugineus]|uniref:uncharacterized protein LOC143198338 n=1 Tax=Rhynchophorus ferrugineus TaxID=354439 RepID=UPI003FCD47CB